jgi:hypothetical protein
MKIKLFFFFLFIPLLLFSADLTSHFIYKTNIGQIDWSDGTILVWSTIKFPEVIKNPENRLYNENDPDQPRNLGQAKLIAKNQAKENVLKNAYKIISDIHINSEKKIIDYLNNPILNNKFNNFINKNYTISDIQYSDDSVTVFAKYSLFGRKGLLALNTDKWESDYIHFNYEKFIHYPQTNKVAYEGVVISAPDIKITPALNPKIYAENGNLIYDSSRVLRNPAIDSGIVIYGKTPFNLLKPVNLHFYHCAALRTTTFHGTDIVISDDDAKTLLSNPDTIQNLKNCKVIILSSDKK